MIRQFNAGYEASEDRILLRMTTDVEEYRFWLTRAGFLALEANSSRAISAEISASHSPLAADLVDELRQEAAERSADRSAPFTPAPVLPLGAAPVLITSIDVSRTDERLNVAFRLAGGRVVTIGLDESAVRQLVALLRGVATTAAWLETGWSAPNSVMPQVVGSVH